MRPSARNLDANRRRLREDSQRLGSLAIPVLIIATGLAVLIAAILSFRIAAGLTRPLRALRTVVGRLDRGDLSARANEQDGPSEVRALARAVNAVGRRARAEAIVDRDAEVFRQRTRLIASTIRRTTSGTQMADLLVRGLGDAMEVDRVWLTSLRRRAGAAADRAVAARAVAAVARTAARAAGDDSRRWPAGCGRAAHIITIDDHRTYEPTTAGRGAFHLAQAIGASASLVVPIGDSASAFGLLWVSMAGHSRHWTLTETGTTQHLAADLAHSLVQSLPDRAAGPGGAAAARTRPGQGRLHRHRLARAAHPADLDRRVPGDAAGRRRRPAAGPAAAMLAIIDRNATRLRNLIEDLLTQSRIDAGRLRLELATVAAARRCCSRC